MYLGVDALQKRLHFRPRHSLQLLYPALGQEEAPQGLAVLLLQTKKSPGQSSGRRGGTRWLKWGGPGQKAEGRRAGLDGLVMGLGGRREWAWPDD